MVFKLGVDLDGVLTRHPDHLRWFADRILMSGGEVHVITGRRDSERQITLEQLKSLRFRFTKLHLYPSEYEYEKGLLNIADMENIGYWKAKVCSNLSINLFLDDNQHWYSAEFDCPRVHI